jgi:hypothetical protein
LLTQRYHEDQTNSLLLTCINPDCGRILPLIDFQASPTPPTPRVSNETGHVPQILSKYCIRCLITPCSEADPEQGQCDLTMV